MRSVNTFGSFGCCEVSSRAQNLLISRLRSVNTASQFTRCACQAVDTPLLPLHKIRSNALKNVFKNFILVILYRKIYKPQWFSLHIRSFQSLDTTLRPRLACQHVNFLGNGDKITTIFSSIPDNPHVHTTRTHLHKDRTKNWKKCQQNLCWNTAIGVFERVRGPSTNFALLVDFQQDLFLWFCSNFIDHLRGHYCTFLWTIWWSERWANMVNPVPKSVWLSSFCSGQKASDLKSELVSSELSVSPPQNHWCHTWTWVFEKASTPYTACRALQHSIGKNHQEHQHTHCRNTLENWQCCVSCEQ